MTQGKFCIVIPFYNNAATLRDVVERSLAVHPDVLVVDDGSTDADAKELLSGLDVKLLRHETNRGKGEALRTALAHLAKNPDYAYMITIDGDGQHYPEDIPAFYPYMEKNDYSLLVGCRDFNAPNVPEGSVKGRRFANFWMKVETGIQVDDCQSGFRAYPVRYVSKIRCSSHHYDYETEILTRSAWAGLEIHNVPVRVYYPAPSERITHFHPFRDNFRISLVHTRLVGERLLPIPKKKLVRKKMDLSIFRPKEFFTYLLKEHADPAGLAAAAAMGSFLAVLPLFAVHTVVIIFFAERLHLNKVMAVGIQNLFMPPFSPVLCIELGYYLRYGTFLTTLTFETGVQELHLRAWEWLLGSLFLAPFWAVVTGSIVFLIASIFQKKGAEA